MKLIITALVPFLICITTCYCGLNQLCEFIAFYDKLEHTAECVMYDNYGCWCGKGGSGVAVDESDACCKVHDKCYDKILAKNKCSPYLDQYTHMNGTCHDTVGSCLFNTCQCDQQLAMCLSKSPYEWRFWGHRLWPGNCE